VRGPILDDDYSTRQRPIANHNPITLNGTDPLMVDLPYR
jgi:hypothetical protein